MSNRIINVGIGFVTGRLLFQQVLKTYINNWLEQGLFEANNIKIHLFITYDLKYRNTNTNDYKNIPPELSSLIDTIHFYGINEIEDEIAIFEKLNILTREETELVFGEGYGKRRNVITYFAVKHRMDKLLFIDDDEYPVATIHNRNDHLTWMGQAVMSTHLAHNDEADITHGHHCGYISPIPFIRFDEILTEKTFRLFIEAVSNDIISWDKVKRTIIQDKGVTYARAKILNGKKSYEVKEKSGMKFISGANLCLNLRRYRKLPPFYNPPKARGEDTFMSTALTSLKVLKVPCYTFHDGFSHYNNLLNGVLPIALKPVDSHSPIVVKRFAAAAVGWIRYKPLLMYVTKPDKYEYEMRLIRQKLKIAVPQLAAYFKTEDFNQIFTEFEQYQARAKMHAEEFEAAKNVWARLMKQMFKVKLPAPSRAVTK